MIDFFTLEVGNVVCVGGLSFKALDNLLPSVGHFCANLKNLRLWKRMV